MDTIVFLAVIASAFIQASWNFFAKKSTADKTSVLAVGWLLLGISLVPVIPYAVDFTGYNSSWAWYSVASAVIHAIYISLLGWGYTVGEISMVYPVARGLGIVWTSLISFALGFHEFSMNGAVGILAIVCGVVLIGHKVMSIASHRKALLIAVAISVIISIYSVLDSFGAKAVPLPFFIMVMNGLTALIVLPFLWRFSRHKVTGVFRSHKIESLLIAAGGSLSYVIILWAFKNSAVSYIAALREFSVVIAAVLGLIVLKEELSKSKIAGVALVTAGAIFLKWS